MIRFLILSVTHVVALVLGVSLGIYALPIVIAPPAPDVARLQAAQEGAAYTASFTRDLPGSDGLYYGKGATTSLSGRAMFQMPGVFAVFERSMIRERGN